MRFVHQSQFGPGIHRSLCRIPLLLHEGAGLGDAPPQQIRGCFKKRIGYACHNRIDYVHPLVNWTAPWCQAKAATVKVVPDTKWLERLHAHGTQAL